MDPTILKFYMEMVKATPNNPSDRQKVMMGVALNHYLDGVDVFLTGTHQGEYASSDYSIQELPTELQTIIENLDPIEGDPEQYMQRGVDLMVLAGKL